MVLGAPRRINMTPLNLAEIQTSASVSINLTPNYAIGLAPKFLRDLSEYLGRRAGKL